MRSAERAEHGLHDVGDVDVIALVRSIAEQGDLLAALPAADEDRDHPAFQVRALTGAIDIRQAQRDRAEVGRFHELFGFRFEASVVRLRIDRDGLVGADRRLAVDRSPRRDVHEDGSAETPRCLEHVPRAADDDALVQVLLRHRLDHFRFRGAVHDGVDPSASDPALQSRQIGNIGNAEVGMPV